MKRILMIIAAAVVMLAPMKLESCAETYEYENGGDSDLYGTLADGISADDIADGLPDGAKQFIYELELTPSDPLSLDNLMSADGLKAVWRYILDGITSPAKSAAVILTAILLCALLGCAGGDSLSESGRMTDICAALICTVTVMLPVTSLISHCSAVISSCAAFMNCLVPVFAALLFAAMRSDTAMGFQAPVFFAVEAVNWLAAYVVTPLSSIYLSLCLSGAVSGQPRLYGLAQLVKKAAMWIISGAMTLYMAAFSVKNIISSSADSAGAKAARFLASSFVPVIGASASDAFASMKSCVGILKNSVGIYAAAAMLIIIIPVIAEAFFWKLTLSLCSGASKMFCASAVTAVIEAVSSMLSILLCVLICTGMMFIFSITVITVAGGGV